MKMRIGQWKMASVGLAGVFAAAVMAAPATAAPFEVLYDFDGGSAAATVTGTGSGNLTAEDATDGGDAQTGFSGGTESTFVNANDIGTDEASALSGSTSNVFEFTIKADTGFDLNINEISYDAGISSSVSGDFTVEWFLRADAKDSFGTTVVTGTSPNGTTSTGSGDAVFNPVIVDVSGDPDFQGLTELTLNLHAYVVSGTLKSSDWGRADNVNITGTVVPEPASLGLLGLGGLMMLGRRRR